MGSINLTTGTASGDFKVGEPFTFTISSANPVVVTITGRDDDGKDYAWFTSNPYPAKIPIGQTSVSATPTEEVSVPDYFTYLVTGMNIPGNAHIVVGDSMPARERHERKAS